MSHCELAVLQDERWLTDRLMAQGLGRQAAESKATLLARAGAVLRAGGAPASAAATACFVPGRIEVLGKHTDYAGGRSMVAAVERGICLAAVVGQDGQLAITDVATGQGHPFPLHADMQPREGHWLNYPMTVARRVARNFGQPLCGAHIAFGSDLPPAAGMSSSSALMVATFLALSALNQLAQRPAYIQNIHGREDLAGYLGTVENGQSFGTLAGDLGVGTFGGSEDHTAILCARPGEISQYSYCPVRFERSIPLPSQLIFVLAVSGVAAEKTGAAMALYNRTSRLAAAAVDVWQRTTGRADPHLAAIVRSSPGAAQRLRDMLEHARHADFSSDQLLDRFEQFLAESEQIIPGVPETLVGQGLQQFGQLVERSQLLGAQRLKNQVPETIFLAESARRLGAAAASAFGAGFGGSVWALVEADQALDFCQRWAEAYAQQHPEHAGSARLVTSGAGPGAFYLASPLV